MAKKNDPPIILLVTQDEFLSAIYTERLEARGYVVRHVVKGERALKVMRSKPPQCLLLDMAIPKEDGFELLDEKQDDSHISDIPVVLLSHLSTPQDVRRAHDLGVGAYCLKLHCHPSLVVKEIEKAISQN